MKAKLNKIVGNVKKNFVPEVKNTGMVVLGLMSGLLISKGIDKLIEKYPNIESWAKFLKPAINAGGGLLIASGVDSNSKYKYFGYGLAGAGALEGIKLIPVAKEFLSGFGSTALLPTVYYTESGSSLPRLDMGNFGVGSMPVGSLNLQAAEPVELELPELEGTYKPETKENSDLGYNRDFTRDADDLSGLL